MPPGRKRFLASYIRWTKMADQNQRRGLVGTNLDGIQQLYAWDVESGELEKRTDAPAGITSGMISADGRYIYYHRDKQGDEIGHFVRIPFEGGEEEDVTPDMVPYSSNTISQSHAGNRIASRALRRKGSVSICWTREGVHVCSSNMNDSPSARSCRAMVLLPSSPAASDPAAST